MTTAARLLGTVALTVLLLLPSSPRPQAAGIPVQDNLAIVRLVAQLAQMAEAFTRQGEELTQARRLVRSLTNANDYGRREAATMRALRLALPLDMELLNNPAELQSIALYGDLIDRYDIVEDELYQPPLDPAVDPPSAESWRANRDAQLAAATSAGTIYDNLKDREDLYEELMIDLDGHEDLKQSLDLLVRLTAENGRLLMELVRLDAAAINAAAVAQLSQQTHTARYRRAGVYEDLPITEWITP